MTDVTLWCDYDCGGSPAESSVTFTYMEGEYTLTLCDACLPKFIQSGPKKAPHEDRQGFIAGLRARLRNKE